MDRENDGTVRDSLTVLLAREEDLDWIILQVGRVRRRGAIRSRANTSRGQRVASRVITPVEVVDQSSHPDRWSIDSG